MKKVKDIEEKSQYYHKEEQEHLDQLLEQIDE